MVHPGIQALLLTPICPHSLSFRPLIFPDSAVISLCMPQDVRSHAWVSFDGRFRHRLMDGDVLEVSSLFSSTHPPTHPPTHPSSPAPHSKTRETDYPPMTHPPTHLPKQVSNSEFPLPTVTHRNVTADWFRALNKAFNFNMRTRQKPL